MKVDRSQTCVDESRILVQNRRCKKRNLPSMPTRRFTPGGGNTLHDSPHKNRPLCGRRSSGNLLKMTVDSVESCSAANPLFTLSPAVRGDSRPLHEIRGTRIRPQRVG